MGAPSCMTGPLTRMTKPETQEDSTGQPCVKPLVWAWPGAKAWWCSCWRNLLMLHDWGLLSAMGATQGSLYQMQEEQYLLVANWASQ